MKRLVFTFFVLSAFGTGLVAAKTVNMSCLESIAYDAADLLEENLILRLNKTKPILFSSLVNLDDLESVSPFGRLFAEQAASRLSQYGYKIIEMKLRKDTIHMKKKVGEMALSRNTGKISLGYEAQAVLTGTYSESESALHVILKLVSTKDHGVLSSCAFSLRMDEKVQDLLNDKVLRKQKSEDSALPPGSPETENSVYEADITQGPLSNGVVLLQPESQPGAKIIQNRLSRLGYYTREIHGDWDRRSKAALMSFKKDHGLPDNSKWDLKVQKRLFQGTGQ